MTAMRQFITNIAFFIWDAIYDLFRVIATYSNSQESLRIGVNENSFNIFLDKAIIDGELISVGLSWRELLLYFLPLFITILTIVLFIKYFLKLLNLFRLD